MAVRCASVLLLVGLALGQEPLPGSAQAGKAGSMGTGAVEGVAGTLPRVPDAPLPAVAPPVSVPMVGSSEPHTASPVVCGVLGGVIVLNWIIACCCAGIGAAGAGAAAGEEAAGNDGAAEAGEATGGIAGALFACVECVASICSIIALVYAAATGLFRAWLGGQAASGWCLAMAIISTLQLLACVCICCCAPCCMSILGAEVYETYVNKHSKHVFGSHMHEMVHKHKPSGTHPITEGHMPMHDTLHKHLPIVRAGGKPKEGKDLSSKDKATEKTPLTADAPSA